MEALDTLNSRRQFTKVFCWQIAAATVITSSSEEAPENVRRDAQGRKSKRATEGIGMNQIITANAGAEEGKDDNNNAGEGPAVIQRWLIYPMKI